MKKPHRRPTLRARRLRDTGAPWRAPFAIDRDSLLGWVVNAFAYGDVPGVPDYSVWADPAVLRLHPLACRCCVGGLFRSRADAEAFLARWPEPVAAAARQRADHIARYGRA